jgi:hypothetical protein
LVREVTLPVADQPSRPPSSNEYFGALPVGGADADGGELALALALGPALGLELALALVLALGLVLGLGLVPVPTSASYCALNAIPSGASEPS